MRTFLIALVCFVLGAVAHRWWSDGSQGAVRTDRIEQQERRDSAELASARAESTRLRDELQRLRAEAPAVREEQASRSPAVTEPPADPGSAREARFTDPANADIIRKVSWKPAGDALTKLMPLLSEANEVAHGRKPMRNELWGEIMTSVGPIITVAIQLETSGVSWSSPNVQLNLLDATLTSAGKPLAEQQIAPLQAIGAQFADADARRKESYGQTVLAVRKRRDKSKLQGELFKAAEPILTPEQQGVLWPAGVRGIVALDVFSAASVWDEHLAHLPHAGRESMRHAVNQALVKQLALRKELQPALLVLVTEWEQRFADEFLLERPSKVVLGDVKMNRTARALAAADAQVTLCESILARLPLNPAEKKKLVELDMVYVPLSMASKSATEGE